MVSPKNFISRKRKDRSSSSLSSNPFIGKFTRSKAQLHLHRSRSGRAWPGRNPFPKQPHFMVSSPLENPRKTHRTLDGTEASPKLSVRKNCRDWTRVRASRMLSSDCVVGDMEGVGFVIEQEFGGKRCSSGVVESDVQHLDLGFKSSGSGLSESGKKVLKNNKDSDFVVAVGCFEQLDKKESLMKTVKGCCLDKRNAPNSGNRLGKVFKAPASFSYRRLLPFLTEMAKNDSGTPCNAQNMEILDSSLPSYASETSVGDKFEERNSQYSESQCPVEGLDLDNPSNSSVLTEEHSEVLTADLANNSSNEMDEFAEECVQTTPPDAVILDKFDIDDRRELGERKTPLIEIQLFGLKPPNISCKEYVSDSANSQRSPSQKSNSSPKAKPFLNQCSRLKIFKTPSFSYRRLLPYLMDVAKSASNNDQPPEFENNFRRFPEPESSPSSGEDISVDNTGHDKVHAEKQVLNACPIAPLINASPAEIYPGNLTPVTSKAAISQSNMQLCVQLERTAQQETATVITDEQVLNACPIAPLINASPAEIYPGILTPVTSKAAISQSDMQLCVQLERTAQQETATVITDVQLPFHLETEIQHNGTLKTSELDCSVATSSSTTECVLRSEPILELSQHQPKNGRHLMERPTLNNSSLPGEGFDHHGIQNHSPRIGILKRNPRGCRGFCNCLNCSSFRLHAERSFEFSRNQLLDAEELAFGLIDELAKLRCLLENSAEDGCDVAAIKCNQLEAKEACTNALITEQVAKQRLSLLNDDLNIHCRQTPLLRPRVTFSKHIEERLIPKRE